MIKNTAFCICFIFLASCSENTSYHDDTWYLKRTDVYVNEGGEILHTQQPVSEGSFFIMWQNGNFMWCQGDTIQGTWYNTPGGISLTMDTVVRNYTVELYTEDSLIMSWQPMVDTITITDTYTHQP